MTTGTGLSARLLVLDPGTAGAQGASRDLIDGLRHIESGLIGHFTKVACGRPDIPVVTTANRSWSYGDLLFAARNMAAVIQLVPGFSRGARIVLLLPNSFEYLAAFYGSLLAGGVVVPLPPTIEDQKFEQIYSAIEAVAVVVPHEARRLPTTLQGQHAERIVLTETRQQDTTQNLSLFDVCENDLAAIFFTSGTTGDPKGVMLSQRNLISNARSIQQYLDIRDSDRPLCLLPFFHAFGNSVLQSHVLSGGTLILDGKTLFPETILTAMNQHQVTSLSGVPDLFRLLLERTSLGKTSLPTLRYMAVAGGALPRELALQVADRIAPAQFFVMYGQTEATARLAYVPPESLAHVQPGCIGHAIPGVQLEVVDEQGDPVTTGGTGELRASGGNVMLGYWKDSQATSDRVRDGWLMTGDLASIDEQGWIYHRGRRNSIVKIAGFRVNPGELEEFAVRSLLVDQAIVVPFEQTHIGTRLALFIRSQTTGLSSSEMMVRCREELPRHLVPSFIHEMDQFPLNHALKIDRIRLTQIAEQESTRLLQRVVPDPSTVKGASR